MGSSLVWALEWVAREWSTITHNKPVGLIGNHLSETVFVSLCSLGLGLELQFLRALTQFTFGSCAGHSCVCRTSL